MEPELSFRRQRHPHDDDLCGGACECNRLWHAFARRRDVHPVAPVGPRRAQVARVGGAHGEHVVARGRVRGNIHAVVAGGRHDHDARVRRRVHELLEERFGRGIARAEAHVDDLDVVLGLVGAHPIQPGEPVGDPAARIAGEDLDADDLGVGGETWRGDVAVGGDDAGHIGAVAVVILGARSLGRGVGRAVPGGEAVLADDVAGQVGVRRVDAGIEHRRRHTGAGDAIGRVDHIRAQGVDAAVEVGAARLILVDRRDERVGGEGLEGVGPDDTGEGRHVGVAAREGERVRRQPRQNGGLGLGNGRRAQSVFGLDGHRVAQADDHPR